MPRQLSESRSPGLDDVPTFSVIMPAYNRQEMLNNAVETVLNQTLRSWELLVVDDHSPSPLTVVRDPRIRLLRRKDNGGFAAGFNEALGQARGHYIAVLADDDAWTANRLANAAAGHAVAQVVLCRSVIMGDVGESIATPKIRSLSTRRVNQRELLASLCAMSLPRSICPSMDESFKACEDLEWAIRLAQTPLTWALLESQDFVWRKHNGPRNLNGLDARIAGSKRLLQEHADYYRSRRSVRSWRLYRIGVMERQSGHHLEALVWGGRSLTTRPNLRAVKLLLASIGGLVSRTGKRSS